MVNALAKPDIALTIMAALVTSPPAKKVKNRDMIINIGAPGGCPTCSLYAEAINSPQSQKLVVGSMVKRYTIAAIRKITHPLIRLTILKLLIV
jgi:hypothetical protein